MDSQKLKEWLQKILEIKEIFKQAKKDNWKTFLDEIYKMPKDILERQLI